MPLIRWSWLYALERFRTSGPNSSTWAGACAMLRESLPPHRTTSDISRTLWGSFRASSHRACACRMLGSATAHCATWPAVNPQSSRIRVQADSFRKMPAFSDFVICHRPRDTWKGSYRTTSTSADWLACWRRNTLMHTRWLLVFQTDRSRKLRLLTAHV